MLDKSKVTKKVWYDDTLWDVVDIISPNKFDDFILLRQDVDGLIHSDDETKPVSMIVLDAHNDTFYPNTRRVSALLKKRLDAQKKSEDIDKKNREYLTDSWLSVFKDQGGE